MMNEVRRVHADWARAWMAKDAAMVDALMAPDYLHIMPTGGVLERTHLLAVIRDPSFRLFEGARTDVTVRVLGTTAALVRDHWRGAGEFRGRPFWDDHVCAFVYERTVAGWQIVFEQCTERTARSAGPT